MNPLEAFASRIESNNIYSDITNSTPISLIVAIYNKAPQECRINYMEGFRALVKWLTHEQGPIDYELHKYPRQIDPDFKLPSLLVKYETEELAEILIPRCNFNQVNFYLSEILRVKKVIVLVSIAEIEEVIT